MQCQGGSGEAATTKHAVEEDHKHTEENTNQ